MNTAAFSLAKASWATDGDISSAVLNRAQVPLEWRKKERRIFVEWHFSSIKKPSITVKLQADNVAGVLLPVFQMAHDTFVSCYVPNLISPSPSLPPSHFPQNPSMGCISIGNFISSAHIHSRVVSLHTSHTRRKSWRLTRRKVQCFV